MKPHIKLVRKGLWSCTGESITRNGVSPSQAYDRWHATAAKTVQAAETPVFKLPPPRIAAAKVDAPLFENWRQRKVRLAKTADYPESMVRRVAGTVETRPWVPPTELRINQVRAAAHQPPMMSISSRAGDLR
jgi:hypothetical protein